MTKNICCMAIIMADLAWFLWNLPYMLIQTNPPAHAVSS